MASVVPTPSAQGEHVIDVQPGTPRPFASPEQLKREIQRAGRALVAILDSSHASTECRNAIQRMAESGESIERRVVEEIYDSDVMAEFVKANGGRLQSVEMRQLVELREALAACATATLTSPPATELMSLWAVVHQSISADAVALVPQAVESVPEVLEAVEDIGDDTVAIGKVLMTALTSSTIFSSSINHELLESIRKLCDAGKPIAEHLVDELHQHLAVIRDALTETDWKEFCSRCAQSVASEWRALGEAAEKVAEQTTDSAQFVKLTSDEIFASPIAKAIAAQGFAGLNGVLGQSREAVDAALDTMLDNGVAAFGAISVCLARCGLPPLLRVEIARDFFQTVGLFFAGLYAPIIEFFEKQRVASFAIRFLNGLHGAYDVVAVNVVALVEEASQNRALIADVTLGVIGVVYFSFLWFAFSGRYLHRRDDEVRQGHEATTWAALAAKQKVRVNLFTYVITACLTIYLPLTRLCLDVILASTTKTESENDVERAKSASDLVVYRFRDGKVWPVIVVAAVILLLTFTIPLPWLLVRAISENRPTGSLENPLVTHDLDGEQVPFDDKIYARLVARDPSQLRCPYRSLYAGFEQRWRYYKVLQLLVKLALVLVIVGAASADVRVRGVLCCILYASVVALSSYSTPFSDPLNNVMEISGKVAALMTCVGGMLSAFFDMQPKKSRLIEVVAVVVSIVHIVNLVVMVVVLLLGMRGTRLFLKNLLGWITFSDTSRGLEDAPARNILPAWEIEKEVKHRVWQAFWRAILLELSQDADKSKGGAQEQTVAHRLQSLEQAVVASGVRRVRSHWRGEENPYNSKLRQATRAALEGVDVFWGDANGARDGHLDSKSCFGKMYVILYPFHCIVVYDDSKDEAIVRDDIEGHSRQSKLAQLLFLNFSPRIVAKRELRQKLRVLSARSVSVHFPFTREEKTTVEDGTVTRTDSEGNTRTETRYSTVSFICYYTQGIIHVATKGDTTKRIMAEGFDVDMTYRDGYGDAVAPHTGKVHHLQHRVAVMGPDHIGLTPAMDESEQLQTIFEQTRDVWEPGVQELRWQHQEYRRALEQKHLQANATLSDGFWYFVYNNPTLSRDELENHLKRREWNSRLQSLVESHKSALDSLYLRMKFVQSHPAVAFWFVFWDDVFARNGEMKRLRKYKRDFDPREPASICYHLMRRPDLENWLRERKLLENRRFFHSRLLTLLYSELEKQKNICNSCYLN